MMPARLNWLAPALAALVLLALPLWLSPYAQGLVAKIMVYALFALSLQLLAGTTGLVSLGHAAFLGVGAYATVLAAPESGGPALIWLLPASMLAAAACAFVVGLLSLRTQGVYFIMVTLAFAQMAFFVFHDTKLAGGSDGLYLYVRPVLALGGLTLLDPQDGRQLYLLVWAALVATYALLALLLRSRFGHALAGIRVNEQRMRAAGYRTQHYKLAAFVIAGSLAGLAGSLLAVKDGVVNPELLSWHESGAVLLMLILGGLGHLRGAVIGAVAFTLLKEFLASEGLVGPLAAHWQLSLGVSIIVLVAALPRGLLGVRSLWKRHG
ncbi:MAG: branched-chain amino acid ABC transporter permease [Rhizobacter sp.]